MTSRIYPALTFLLIITSLLFAQSSQKANTLTLNNTAPTFFLKTLTGEDFFLSDYCGVPRQPWKKPERKMVVLSFFATYCLPCLKEIPQLQELAEEKEEDAIFVLIDLKEEPEKVAAFVESQQIKLPVLLDRFGVVGDKYGVDSLPTLFFIDGGGKIRYMQRGYSEDLIKNLRKVWLLARGE